MTRPAAHGAASGGPVEGGPFRPAPTPPFAPQSSQQTPATRPSAPTPPTTIHVPSTAPIPSASSETRTTPDGIPKLYRLADQRLVAGVAAGLAAHLRARVSLVRIAFVVLGLVAGAGVVGYALLWIFVPQSATESGPADPSAARRSAALERRQAVGIAAVGIAAGIVTLALGVGQWVGALFGPLVIVAVGAAFLWREADDAQRQRWRRTAAGWARPSRRGWWRIVAGIVLVVGGLAVFAIAQVDVASARSAVIAVVLTLVGVAVIAIPWLVKLLRDLTDERRERIREAEKAEVAAHLHDSVLQTLALIQRQPNDARQVQRLARAQERDLRAWLYGPDGYARGGPVGGGIPTDAAAPSADGREREEERAATCAEALRHAAAQVEDTYSIEVGLVVVGDLPLTERTSSLVASAREAMVNAAKHAGVDSISVYAELETPQAAIYVRDRGRGFDPAEVPADRRGVAESIRGRMERCGGRAELKSAPGSGAEWTLTLGVGPSPTSASV